MSGVTLNFGSIKACTFFLLILKKKKTNNIKFKNNNFIHFNFDVKFVL